jgi:hypothetical protein
MAVCLSKFTGHPQELEGKMMASQRQRVLKSMEHLDRGDKYLLLRIIAALLIGTWAVLLMLGKGGFVHILVLNGIGVAAVDVMTVLRSRMVR